MECAKEANTAPGFNSVGEVLEAFSSILLDQLGISADLAERCRRVANVPEHRLRAFIDRMREADVEVTSELIDQYAGRLAAERTCGTSLLKRRRNVVRRSSAQIWNLKDALHEVIAKYRPMTVRQVYYQAVSRGLIEKTEAAYKLVCRLLADMRRDQYLPYDWLADNTRWMRKPRTHSGLAGMLEHAQHTYRRAIWDEQEVYVEVWLEKEALAGVLYDVTAKWDVPLMVTRGYPSMSFIHSAAESIASENKPVYLYYFGDHDPSGVDIPRNVEEGVRELAPQADLHFERIAVTVEQIDEFNLPTRPTKKTDSRSKSFEGESVEVDAIEPDELRRLAEECIVQHVDHEVLNRMKTVEEAERETLRIMAEQLEAN